MTDHDGRTFSDWMNLIAAERKADRREHERALVEERKAEKLAYADRVTAEWQAGEKTARAEPRPPLLASAIADAGAPTPIVVPRSRSRGWPVTPVAPTADAGGRSESSCRA